MFLYFVINKKMITDLNISHRKMSEFISIQLFPFTLVIKLQSFDFEIQWNISIFLIENHVTFEYVPWKNSWFCFVSNVWVNFSHKTSWNFHFESHWNTWLFFIIKKQKCYIWIRPVKQYLIGLKLRCLCAIFAISWEIRILNFIFQLRNLLSDQNLSWFLSYKYFLHYYRNSIRLKKFLMILG